MSDEDLLSRLHDLYKQATVERSHYYAGSLVKETIEHLERYKRNLRSRDDFIVGQGLWLQFVDSLPPAHQSTKSEG